MSEQHGCVYEAYFHLISVQGVPHVRAWCLDEACEVDGEAWSARGDTFFDTREAGLVHCREKHVSGETTHR